MSATPGPGFSAWLDDFFVSYYRRRPVNATFIGVHTYDDRLPDLSESGIAATLGDAEHLLARLHQLPDEPLTPWQALDRQLAEGFLIIQRWESTSRHFGLSNPIHFTGEAIFGLVSLLLRPTEQRLHAATARLEQVPAFLQTGIEQIRSAPQAWIDRARHECEGARLLLADVSAGFASLGVVASRVATAFDRFDRHLQDEVRPTRDYASGADALELQLRYAHMATTNADGVERVALERLAAEEDALRTSPPPLPDETRPALAADYLTRFDALWRSVRDFASDHAILTFPDWPVRFVERPDWARRAAPYLYFLPYRSPAPFDAPPVVDYLTPPGADDSTIKLNHVIHHAGLGHHLQNWFAAQSESRIGRMAAVDCASRIAMLCGGTLAEGWANYATDLAEESYPGLLTPAERYGQHRARMRMAARAVVDIRLHQGRFTLEEAIDFYAVRVGMPASAARAEAVKNSLFPGAACMYLIGWHTIWRLRRELESRATSPFDLHAFHDRFLSFGSVPVSLIARAMLESTAVPALSQHT
jgi:uncharacterized protein (DUF885 family)